MLPDKLFLQRNFNYILLVITDTIEEMVHQAVPKSFSKHFPLCNVKCTGIECNIEHVVLHISFPFIQMYRLF